MSAAATFALLNAAMALAIDYMMIIDAHGYDWRGITGAFLTEALVSGSACVLFTIILRRRLLTARPTEEPTAYPLPIADAVYGSFSDSA